MDTSAAESSIVPWDTTVGNRFAHYSSENHSATVWIAAALALTYVVGVLLIRVFIKWRVFGWDDGLIVVSTVCFSYKEPDTTTDPSRYLRLCKASSSSVRSPMVLARYLNTLEI